MLFRHLQSKVALTLDFKAALDYLGHGAFPCIVFLLHLERLQELSLQCHCCNNSGRGSVSGAGNATKTSKG
jgi:hypothetical protein